jgi:hypothetical protein
MENRNKKLKARAVRLRKKGLSYGQIKIRIKVSKSTLSFWLKSVALNFKQRQKLYTRQVGILNRGAQSQKQRREREIDQIIRQAIAEIPRPLSLCTYQLFGAALYWAEGSKGRMFQMTNSDPQLILFWVKWLQKVFKLPSKILKARLNIYPQQNEKEIKQFWSDLTKIPVKNFGKSYIKPLSKNYKTNNLYYGTIRIEVPKSTDLRHRVYGWTQTALKDIAPRVKVVQRKWGSLEAVARPVNLV